MEGGKAMALASEVVGRMNTEKAAAFLGLRPSTLNNWRGMGKGPRYIRLGNRVVYRREDLDAFLQAQTVETTQSRAA